MRQVKGQRLKVKSFGFLFIIFNFIFYIFNCFFSGCATTKTVVKKGYDFSNIKKIAVLKFSGIGGEAVANEFIRQFLASGISVIDRSGTETVDSKSLGVDAVISGNVVEFNPSNKLLIFKEKGDIVISDRAYPISGTTVLPTGSAFGLEDANVFSVSASVSVSAKMTDTTTGEVVWSDSNSYEALDINTAVELITSSFKSSLKKYWKELN
ncbi:MAG: hypothetical protein COS68_00280 [Elusimicrobia bacterium CG06_land_8_20_14_3_00_38_11]|nr:MAG: hypothetical protein COS68_00280 [Elusimicrobia bacterium CG06_land_8_20_14_3_00_38_11]